jgi:cytoskeletal protein CcmA (bactofilin family)
MKKFWNALLITLLALSIATPALAFDGRSGESILIGAEEVIEDDLYIGATTFTLDGTVNGDVVAAGETVTINGTVNGDVIAAGSTVIINGKVSDDVRIAGAVLLIGKDAVIGGDVIAAGASLETKPQSKVGADVVFTGAQALLAGEVARNGKVACGGLDLQGSIGGDLYAAVGNPDEGDSAPGPMFYTPNSPVSVPSVRTGLNIAPEAEIGGRLEYVSAEDLPLPPEAIGGPVVRLEPEEDMEETIPAPPTPTESLLNGIFSALRSMVTLFLLGAALLWLFPAFMQNTANTLRGSALPAFGWGMVSWAAFFFALLVVITATIIGGIVFGALTLGGLSGTVIWVGIFTLFLLSLGFVLAVIFVAPLSVALTGGEVLLQKFKPEWAANRFGALGLGVVLLAILTTLPWLGGLFGMLFSLAGLGALWLQGRSLLQNGSAQAAA